VATGRNPHAAHHKGIVFAQHLSVRLVCHVRVQWSASNEGGVQSLARRSRYRNTAALNKFECDCFLTQKTRFGNLGLRKRNRSSFGPNFTRPAQIWPYRVRPYGLSACVPDPNCSEPSREGRASICNRAVECRFRAIYLRTADGRFCHFGAVKSAISRNGDIYKHIFTRFISGLVLQFSECIL
jgi:hypothetical protein